MQRTCFTLVLALWLSLTALGQSYTMVKDISYSSKTDEYARERLKLDIATPAGKTGCPVAESDKR